MKFYLVDRIDSLEAPDRIVASKCLTSAEEYLADHFPAFPVMPGVMMLEACAQAAAYLVRIATDWSVSMVTLQRARNVRYANFVAPGQTLRIEATAGKSADGVHAFSCVGSVDGETAVQAKIDLKAFNLADTEPSLAEADRRIIEQMTQRFRLIGGKTESIADSRLQNAD